MKNSILSLIIILNTSALLSQTSRTTGTEFSKYSGPYLGQKPPGEVAEIFAPDLFPPDDPPHGSPVFTPDGKEIYLPGILVMKNIAGRWTLPVKASFSEKERGVNPTISPDGKKLIFLLPYQPENTKQDMTGSYIVDREGDSWTVRKRIDKVINALPREWDVSISGKGTLFFSSSVKGGFGGSDLYKSIFTDGKYSAPLNLGKPVNNQYNITSVYVSPLEEFLIYSSHPPGGEGDEDLYVSFYNSDGSWGEGINLGKNINTSGTEMWPNMTPDGKYLFFIRAQDGKAFIYWVDAKVIKKLKPK